MLSGSVVFWLQNCAQDKIPLASSSFPLPKMKTCVNCVKKEK